MWDFAWTDSVTLVEKRVLEELFKRGQGELKVAFSIPMNWVDEFDIFSNFRLQDEFGLDALGEGEYGRYYYVESLTYDFLNQRIDVVAVDLQFLLRQCIILGDCRKIPLNWVDATEAERMYGYLCACESGEGGIFPDGELCKVLCPCV